MLSVLGELQLVHVPHPPTHNLHILTSTVYRGEKKIASFQHFNNNLPMSTNEDWDVEKHKLEHECDEHWELRKSFLVAHKDKFAEEQLVCLAQVFTNVELLGCRYPQETMEQIAELSKDVAADYRERQKSKLQRTFVKASDAASSKVKGSTKSLTHTVPTTSNEISRKNSKNTNKCPVHPIFKDFVIMKHPNSTQQNILDTSARMNGRKIEWKCKITEVSRTGKPLLNASNKTVCELYLDGVFVNFGYGNNKKEAKAKVAEKIMRTISKIYYTIEIKDDWKSSLLVKQVNLKEPNEPTQELFNSNNVGVKLMKSMGWGGGGLGKSQQGAIEPVTMKRQLCRSGIGLKLDPNNMNVFKKKCEEALNKFVRDCTPNDHLAFADLSHEERRIMHECALKVGLKSESYGPQDQRVMIVSLKFRPKALLNELLKIGKSTDKYILHEPKISTSKNDNSKSDGDSDASQ